MSEEKERDAESILKPGRFSKEGSDKKKQEEEGKATGKEAAERARFKAKEEEEKKEMRKVHIHTHRRNVVECSIVCTNEEEQQRYNELPAVVRVLFKNLQKVDKMVCLEPVVVGDAERLFEAGEIPYDHTDLGSWVKQGGGMNAYAMKKAKRWGKGREEVGEDEGLVMPEIYFTISFSCDKDPSGLLEQVAGEWGKMGGRKLYMKEIPSFSTMSVCNIFHLRHYNTPETVLEEFQQTLEEAKEIAEYEDEDGWLRFSWNELPILNVRKLMPKIPGQDTSKFKNWTGRQHENRKVLAIEADENDVEMIQYLVETAKNRQLFEKCWGHMIRVTIAVDNRHRKRGGHQTQLQVDMAAVASYNRKHINYNANTRMDGIRGIFHLDKQVPFYTVSDPTKLMGRITLRLLDSGKCGDCL